MGNGKKRDVSDTADVFEFALPIERVVGAAAARSMLAVGTLTATIANGGLLIAGDTHTGVMSERMEVSR